MPALRNDSKTFEIGYLIVSFAIVFCNISFSCFQIFNERATTRTLSTTSTVSAICTPNLPPKVGITMAQGWLRSSGTANQSSMKCNVSRWRSSPAMAPSRRAVSQVALVYNPVGRTLQRSVVDSRAKGGGKFFLVSLLAEGLEKGGFFFFESSQKF